MYYNSRENFYSFGFMRIENAVIAQSIHKENFFDLLKICDCINLSQCTFYRIFPMMTYYRKGDGCLWAIQSLSS